jgi:hypothetical protein
VQLIDLVNPSRSLGSGKRWIILWQFEQSTAKFVRKRLTDLGQ